MIKHIQVAESEKELIDAIQKIEFGELLEVEIKEEDPSFTIELEEPFCKLINVIRRDGLAFIDRIQVHQSVPTYAEVNGSQGGFRCRKKYKFGK
jgi:hypothetical protein